ncbi:hypothetical protein NDU88_005691 [Pleurodeles waltl]|uniref:Poly [ADP-ribose] polymerase n=1 Tax=Pleurodeles waltl TaxID=8319 RepID=A0AAV7SMF4_PLEWA|nr:hypothetical protein NDU88_005691 [Pleurodeles waltl]
MDLHQQASEGTCSKMVDGVMEEMDISDTQWGWFYLAECGKWHLYQTDTTVQCSISSEEIEYWYKLHPMGTVNFNTVKFNYVINFAEMNQTNVMTGKSRPVKRAPFSISAFSYVCGNEAIPVPSHWENVTKEEPYQLIILDKNTNEYKEVAGLFGKTMDSQRILNIRRIQNLDLWEFFCRKKAQLKRKRRVAFIDERMLFHGTSNEFVEAICSYNFDWRLSGMHGSMYGKGTYFATNAMHSSPYCIEREKNGDALKVHGVTQKKICAAKWWKTMILARVLVGESAVGHPNYLRPPSKDGSIVNLYDSCVDSTSDQKIYVIFDANQIYPEYVIEFV